MNSPAMRPERLGLSVAVALHALAAVLLLSYEPARKSLLAAAPIMVDFIVPPAAEPPKPELPVALPKPKPVIKPSVRRPVEMPILASPVESPAPNVVAPPPPSPVVVAPQSSAPVAEAPSPVAPPLLVTQPIYNADYLDNPAPHYPARSRRAGEQGRVVLRVLVSPRGTADDVQVFTSSGHPRLDEAARDAVRRWKFVPAKRGSEPLQAWVRIPIPFTLN
jgi:periplasmic protein TonB